MNDRKIEAIFFSYLGYVLFLLAFLPDPSQAKPAGPEPFEIRQPSGETFLAIAHGDEWYNWIDTMEGYGIVRNRDTGYWEYILPENGSRVSEKRVGKVDPASLGIPKGLKPPRPAVKPMRWIREPSRARVTGTVPIVVIGIDYNNRAAQNSASLLTPLVFGSSGSVKDYYAQASYSAVTVTTATESNDTANDGVIAWLRLNKDHPNPGTNIGDDNRQISKEAIQAADPYIDFAPFDTDGDGEVSTTELGILVVVAGYDASSGGTPGIWPHAWAFFGAVPSPTVDGKTVEGYCQIAEIEKSGSTEYLSTIGVMVHELGHHIFGWPDLYDTDNSSEGIGNFGVMGTGLYGRTTSSQHLGVSPVYPCAWSRMYQGWGTVSTFTRSARTSFPKVDGNGNSIVRINTSDADEYFLLENREFTGYDEGYKAISSNMTHGGMAIYHVNEAVLNSTFIFNNDVNDDETNKGLDVEEANEGSLGFSQLDTKAARSHYQMFFFQGNNFSFTGSTTPNSNLQNGTATGIGVTNISANGDTMTADIATSNPTPTPTLAVPAVSSPGLAFLVFLLTLALLFTLPIRKMGKGSVID